MNEQLIRLLAERSIQERKLVEIHSPANSKSNKRLKTLVFRKREKKRFNLFSINLIICFQLI